MELSPADARVHVNAAALMAEEDTSNTSDTETNSVAGEHDVEAEDQDLEATDNTNPNATVSANQTAPRTKKATANFAKLTRRQVVFADELAQLLKQLGNNANMADLAPAHSSVGRTA